MADNNNNGKDDLVEVLEQAKDHLEAAKERRAADNEKTKRVKKIIKTVLIVYVIIQFAPMFIGGIMMGVAMFAEINTQLEKLDKANEILPLPDEVPLPDSSVSADELNKVFDDLSKHNVKDNSETIDPPSDLYSLLDKLDNFGVGIQEWFDKTFLDNTTSIFANSGSIALTILAALVVGMLLIIVLRAVTTKKGPTDEEITTELRNKESLFGANTSTSVESKTSISECTNTNSNTDNTAEEDTQTDSDVSEL